ncbi:MAG: rhomboid family intramembrane serine protease [Bacteroidota bacterium]
MLQITPTVKNLLIINVIIFLGQMLFDNFTGIMALWWVESQNFAPYQYFTYMFAHGDMGHLFFNMLGLFFLGPMVESYWGANRFLIFYMAVGIGASFFYTGIRYYEVNQFKQEYNRFMEEPSADRFEQFAYKTGRKLLTEDGYQLIDNYAKNPDNPSYRQRSINAAREIYAHKVNNGSMLGASGAIYGLILALGMLFPERELRLLFPPIALKAKYFALIFGGLALYMSLQGQDDGVAHFAHLGGMVFAFIFIKKF